MGQAVLESRDFVVYGLLGRRKDPIVGVNPRTADGETVNAGNAGFP